VPQPRLRLVAGGVAAAPWPASLTRTVAIELDARRTDLADGSALIADLPAGDYVVTATAPAAAMPGAAALATVVGVAAVALAGADADVTVTLPAAVAYTVRVLGPRGEAVRGAVIHVEGQRPPAFCAGRTDDDGVLRVAIGSDEITVSADHPRWGCVQGRAAAAEGVEVLLRMQEPGWIDGTLHEHGRPPSVSRTIAALHLPDVRGPIEPAPILVATGADGAFALRALQPGRYRVRALRPTPATATAAALAEAWSQPWPAAGTDVVVVSGRGAHLDIDLGADAVDGATAHVSGTVQVDGRMANGCAVSLWADGRLRDTEVDAAGRFDFGRVPAASALVRVFARSTAATQRVLWQRELQLQPGEERALAIEVATVAIDGEVVRPDGSPAAGVLVQASTRPLAGAADPMTGNGPIGDGGWHAEVTDARGRFAFAGLPAGVYCLQVRTAGRRPDPGLHGVAADIHADGGRIAGVRIELQAASRVAGRLDLRDLPRAPEHLSLVFRCVDAAPPPGSWPSVCIVADVDGSFWTDELPPGKYELRVTARLDEWREFMATDQVTVPPQGIGDLFVRLRSATAAHPALTR